LDDSNADDDAPVVVLIPGLILVNSALYDDELAAVVAIFVGGD